MKWKIANAAGAAAIVACAWLLNVANAGYRPLFDFDYQFAFGQRVLWSAKFLEIFGWAAAAYAAAYALWFLAWGPDRAAKPVEFWRGLAGWLRRPLAPVSDVRRAALLNVAVKATFVPLVTLWTFTNVGSMARSAGFIWQEWGAMGLQELYARHLHWALLYFILTVDVGFFLLGYLLEHPRLGNVIRSVEPTLGGWLAALACYPLLATWTGKALGWYATDFPDFAARLGETAATRAWSVGVGILVIVLMSVYAWASVALGLKASNLTNRGTVSRGPYRWVRHPAYAAKNLAWIISGSVAVAGALRDGVWGLAAAAVLSLTAWAFVYHLRALTEERHLSADPEYRSYAAKVKWRYLPGVY